VIEQCKHCLYGYNDDETLSKCYSSGCEYFTPLTQEIEDEMIADMIEQGRRDYYNIYIKFANDDFYFD
jgi:hypothetical protein